MDDRTLIVTLDPLTIQALRRIAADEDLDVSAIVRRAIERDLYRRSRAKKADRPDERLVAPLRALLADDFAYAVDWTDLLTRLAHKGFALRESGGGLILVRHPSGDRVAKASELGYSYSRLMRRIGAPFPGHRHAYLFRKEVSTPR